MKTNLTKESALLVAVILSVFVVFAFMVGFFHIGYYSESDLFGLFTSNAEYFYVAAFLISLSLVFLLRKKHFKVAAVVILPVFLLLLLKYVLPNLIETYYVTSFSDAPGQLVRGLFVTNTGHSSINVDGYYDLQPSFFWATGEILQVISGNALSLLSPISAFIMKWFEVIVIVAFFPLLFFFYKKLLGSLSLVGAALLLQFALDSNHYHYAAESYGTFLYWICLALMLCYSVNKGRWMIVILSFIGFSLVFLHQGLTIFLLVSMVAVVAYPYVFRIVEMKSKLDVHAFSKRFWIPLLILISGWFTYLIFTTVYTFGTFVTMLQGVFTSLVSENVSLISSGVQRTNPLWQQVVTWKAVYLGVVILMGLLLSFINARRTKSNIDKAVFTIQLFMIIVVGGIAVALGGAGYIERLLILLPLITYSLIKFTSNTTWVSNTKWRLPKLPLSALAVFLITIIILSGLAFYFSGRNFQSTTRSELTASNFSVIYAPQNIAELYSRPIVHYASALFVYKQVSGTTYVISYHDSIQTAFYITGNYQDALSYYSNLTAENNQIYDNNKAQLIRSPGS